MREPMPPIPLTALQRWILESQRALLARSGPLRPTEPPARSGEAVFRRN
jgi:hypothetical protein